MEPSHPGSANEEEGIKGGCARIVETADRMGGSCGEVGSAYRDLRHAVLGWRLKGWWKRGRKGRERGGPVLTRTIPPAARVSLSGNRSVTRSESDRRLSAAYFNRAAFGLPPMSH